MPEATAVVMPPTDSTSSSRFRASSASCAVRASSKQEPARGSATWVMPFSSAKISWVLRAIRAEASLGATGVA